MFRILWKVDAEQKLSVWDPLNLLAVKYCRETSIMSGDSNQKEIKDDNNYYKQVKMPYDIYEVSHLDYGI